MKRIQGAKGSYIQTQASNKHYFLANREEDGLAVVVKKVRHLSDEYLHAIKTLESIDHSSIARTIELVEDGDDMYVVRTYHEGTSLKDVLETRRLYHRLPERFMVDVVIRLLEVLGIMHSYQLLHLDVKPANIILQHKKDVPPSEWKAADMVLIDFEQSLCYPVSKGYRNRFTLVYSPPEQLLNRLFLLCPASDLSAVGIMLYELIAGSPPYVDCNAEILLNLQLSYPIQKRPRMSQALFDIIAKAAYKERFPKPPRFLGHDEIVSVLQKGIAGRYQEAESFRKDLLVYRDSLPEVIRQLPWWRRWFRKG